MTVSLVTALRSTRATAILTALDAGAGASLIKIYSGSVPADANTALGAQVLLGTLTCTDPSGSVTNGVLTMSTITQDSSADASGTASFFRHTDSTGAVVLQGTVGTSGADLNLNTTTIVSGGPIAISSYVWTDGNA